MAFNGGLLEEAFEGYGHFPHCPLMGQVAFVAVASVALLLLQTFEGEACSTGSAIGFATCVSELGDDEDAFL
jgi:hypothetical protein